MEDYTAEMIKDMAFSFCPQCGTAIVPNHKGRPRKFCSPECRSRWNNTHPKPENWRTVRSKICPVCGREFSYADMKASIDDATWWAKYMGKPYVREGLLFPADELRYFNGVLPDGEPDRKLMVMDIAWGGGDFTTCPIAYVYGDAVFIPDLVFNNGDKTVTRPEVVGKIIQHKINVVRGEANNGGDEYCDVVDSQLRQQGYCTTPEAHLVTIRLA